VPRWAPRSFLPGLFAALVAVALPTGAVMAESPLSIPIQQHVLANGLRVLLSEDHTVPVVAIAVYYDVGSRVEVRGRSGFAHLFEHMMFQGSASVGKAEHFQYVNNRGGTCNGTTSEDRTNYFETLPSSELELGLWLEADRMRSLAVTAENFENQRQTVMEERRQSYENRPYALSFLRINELAFQGYWPYEHSTIGEMADLQRAPLEAVQEFFRSYYAPNNAILALVGDIDPAEAMRLVERHFGRVSPHPTPPFEDPSLPVQAAERAESMPDALAQLPATHLAYHIPPARHPDHYALDILATVLGDGESSRLYLELVKERELVQDLNVGTDNRRGPDLFSFFLVLAEGKTGAEVRTHIDRQIADVIAHGVTPRELEKAKNRTRASFVFRIQTAMQRAMRLTEFWMYWGDPSLLLTELDRYLAVTNDDIKRVAAQYLVRTNRTVLDVVPAPPEAAQAAAPAAH
jgi:predicted Zn-dependent peptidase